MRPLYLVCKKMLWRQGLTDPSKGGLKCICLIYMIVAFLREMRKQQNLSEVSLGQMLINFLYFYSFTFSYKTQQIFIQEGTQESFFLKMN